MDDSPVASGPLPKPGAFFERTDWQSFCLTSAVIFAVYLFTLNPNVDLGFSGVLATGAFYGGVPHPPGFPLWTIYAHMFTVLLPFSNVAWRISISSAFASAIACGLIGLMVSRVGALILENLKSFPRLPAKSEKGLRIFAGYAAGMSFGLCGCVWSHSLVPDWWPLNFALFATMLCLLARWSYAAEKTRYLYAAILTYCATLTNTQVPCLSTAIPGLLLFVLFIQPALARDLLAVTILLLLHTLFVTRNSIAPSLWVIYLISTIFAMLLAIALAIKTRKVFTEWKAILGCFLFIALGLSICFYSPIASITNPPMNWAYPRTADGFMHMLTRGQYDRPYPVNEWARYITQIDLYCRIICSDFGWLYLLPAAVPFFFIHRMRSLERRWLLGLLALFLCESLFQLAFLNPGNDKSSRDLHRIYFAPSFLLLAIFTGCGLVLLGTMLARPQSIRLLENPSSIDPVKSL